MKNQLKKLKKLNQLLIMMLKQQNILQNKSFLQVLFNFLLFLIKDHLFENVQEFIHFCCTSEDINNLAYSLMLNDAKQFVLTPLINLLKDKITNIALEKKNISMLSRTHGLFNFFFNQLKIGKVILSNNLLISLVASPTTVGKEFANFGYRLYNTESLISKHMFSGKMNGAVGNYNSHLVTYPNLNWPALSSKFINQLGLKFCPYTTQCDSHDNIAQFYSYISQLNTILIGFARDIWHYISIGYLIQKQVATETGSSTMPHKVNPIDFENAEGNLGLSQALCMHMMQKLPIKRWQRDLSDSTVMRNHGVIFGYNIVALKSLVNGLNKIEVDEQKVKKELESHWEVLAEPIQMVMRKWGIENPYEIMKKLTRGKNVSKEILHDMIKGAKIPAKEKEKLLKLTPETYIGYANELSDLKKFL